MTLDARCGFTRVRFLHTGTSGREIDMVRSAHGYVLEVRVSADYTGV